jgi:gluconate kinase
VAVPVKASLRTCMVRNTARESHRVPPNVIKSQFDAFDIVHSILIQEGYSSVLEVSNE